MSKSIGRSLDSIKAYTEEIRYWLGRFAFESVWTFEKTLQWRTERLYDQDRYKKLPRWAVERISGILSVYDALHQAKLVWTHVLDGRRSHHRDPRFENRHVEISNQEPNLSAFCYALNFHEDDGGLIRPRRVYVPFLKETRDNDIASGRLTADDLVTIATPRTKMCKVEHLIPLHDQDVFRVFGWLPSQS